MSKPVFWSKISGIAHKHTLFRSEGPPRADFLPFIVDLYQEVTDPRSERYGDLIHLHAPARRELLEKWTTEQSAVS